MLTGLSLAESRNPNPSAPDADPLRQSLTVDLERNASTSQAAHRTLRDIAADLVYTGEEPIRGA